MSTLILPKNQTLKAIVVVYLLFLSFSVAFCTEKQLIFLGGGGEPAGPTTMFDNHINVLSRFVNSKGAGWDVSYSFNGGHKFTENFLEQKLLKGRSLGSFNAENFARTLDDLERSLHSGALAKNNQLMLIIDTHGAVKLAGEKTHSVALSATKAENLKNLSGAETVSMDKLESLINLADEKGVKLAIIDLSCFSGNTLKLATKNTCIISASGEDQYGYNEVRKASDLSPYSTFGGIFYEKMKSGGNLEDIFLAARAKSGNSPDFPMISTEVGRQINELIYKLITPYLLYNDEADIDFSDSYGSGDFSLALCKTQVHYEEIKKRLDEIGRLASIPKNLPELSKLKKVLQEYRNYQLYYEKALQGTQKVSEEVKAIIARDYPEQAALFRREDGLAIISVERQESLKLYKQWVDEASDEWNKRFYQKLYDDLLIKDQISKDVKNKLSPGSKSAKKKFDDIFAHSYKTRDLAEKVSVEAKKLYDKLYRAQKSSENNPCKDFVL